MVNARGEPAGLPSSRDRFCCWKKCCYFRVAALHSLMSSTALFSTIRNSSSNVHILWEKCWLLSMILVITKIVFSSSNDAADILSENVWNRTLALAHRRCPVGRNSQGLISYPLSSFTAVAALMKKSRWTHATQLAVQKKGCHFDLNQQIVLLWSGVACWSGLGTASQQSSWMYWMARLSHQWIFSSLMAQAYSRRTMLRFIGL